jgi:hypothetical protein
MDRHLWTIRHRGPHPVERILGRLEAGRQRGVSRLVRGAAQTLTFLHEDHGLPQVRHVPGGFEPRRAASDDQYRVAHDRSPVGCQAWPDADGMGSSTSSQLRNSFSPDSICFRSSWNSAHFSFQSMPIFSSSGLVSVLCQWSWQIL